MKYTMLNDCPDCKGEYRCNHGKCDCGYCDTCRGTGKVSAEISAGEIEDISKNLFRKAEEKRITKSFHKDMKCKCKVCKK